MKNEEKMPSGLIHSTDELRRLIIDNPTLPLLVFAGEEANGGDYMYTSCSYVRADVGEFLDCKQEINDEKCYCDRDDFEEDLADALCDDFTGSNEDFEARVRDEAAKYDPYWKKCIILYVNN